MVYTMKYFRADGHTGEENWDGELAPAKDLARNVVAIGTADRVIIYNVMSQAVFRYPPEEPPHA